MINFLDYLYYDIEKPLIFNSGLFLFFFLGFLGVFILFRKQRIARAKRHLAKRLRRVAPKVRQCKKAKTNSRRCRCYSYSFYLRH